MNKYLLIIDTKDNSLYYVYLGNKGNRMPKDQIKSNCFKKGIDLDDKERFKTFESNNTNGYAYYYFNERQG